jgi:hypothetical protein
LAALLPLWNLYLLFPRPWKIPMPGTTSDSSLFSIAAAASAATHKKNQLAVLLLLLHTSLMQYPRPEYVAADLGKVKLADALATTSFNPAEPALFTVGKSTRQP